MSDYVKTGKKIKSIVDDRLDLTYRKVYDVFIDDTGCEFIIDDVGDWRYNLNSASYKVVELETKFNIGDKVEIVDIDYISDYTDVLRVGDIGIIARIDDDDSESSYCVKFDESITQNSWRFTDKCIKLVGSGAVNDTNTPNKKYNPLAVQQSGNHYKNGEIQPIEYSERNNLSMCQGNIVKYITRHKEKNGVDDLAKVVHYALLEALFVYGLDGVNELRDKIDKLINI